MFQHESQQRCIIQLYIYLHVYVQPSFCINSTKSTPQLPDVQLPATQRGLYLSVTLPGSAHSALSLKPQPTVPARPRHYLGRKDHQHALVDLQRYISQLMYVNMSGKNT